ncbi:TPR repeat region-containing protein [Streptomonospora wellingtoniae]|uniref:TPR repeat domain-containing protein n=1 Tax=Streptomonospora wellingtoniae TaxID=3075544 RepID=A0ABU2KT85_9ACTN|nr:hypothetical protein [Streptomonospora sp. DSM 45055]MDT0302506.1 hypothetical protein [Streptomonospora sp. DSM 45055]
MSSFDPEGTDADAEAIDDRAVDLYNVAGRILGRSAEELKPVLTSAAVQFSDLVAEGIREQSGYSTTAWQKASFAAVYAAGVTEGWASDVRWFTARIAELEDEWEQARADDFGARMRQYSSQEESDRAAQGLPSAGEAFAADRSAGRIRAVADLESRERTSREEFERRARARATQLRDGPTDDTVRTLVRQGRLGWAPHNMGWSDPPLPLAEERAARWAEELRDYLTGDRPVDARYAEIVAALGALTRKGWWQGAHGGRERLPRAEMDFLEEFYRVLDTEPVDGEVPPTMLTLVREVHGNGGLSERARNELLGALGDGLLTLSDEDRGGGWDALPPSIRSVASGSGGIDYDGARWPVYGWRETRAPLLDRLLAFTNPGIAGGREFSEILATTLGNKLQDYAQTHGDAVEDRRDGPFRMMLSVAARNEDSVHGLFTGAVDHPQGWGAQRAVRGLYAFPWSDDGRTLRELTDWMSYEDVRSDPDRRELADEAAAGLIRGLAHDQDTFDLLSGGNTVTGSGMNLGMLNPEAARGLADVAELHIAPFAQEGRLGPTEYGGGSLKVNSADRVRFWMLAAGDTEAANDLSAAVQGYQSRRFADLVEDGADAAVVGGETGRLRGLYDLAVLDEALAREHFAAEDAAAEQGAVTTDRRGVALASGITKELLNNFVLRNPAAKAATGIAHEVVRFGRHYLWEAPSAGSDYTPRLPTTRGAGDIQYHSLVGLADAAVADDRLDPGDLPAYRRYRELGAEYDRHAAQGDAAELQETVDELAGIQDELRGELTGALKAEELYDPELIDAQRDAWEQLLGDPEAHDAQRYADTVKRGRLRRNQPTTEDLADSAPSIL